MFVCECVCLVHVFVCVCVCFQVTGGQFNLTLDVDHVYTLSTSTGQTHGDYPDVPVSQIFPVPYSDDFESEYMCTSVYTVLVACLLLLLLLFICTPHIQFVLHFILKNIPSTVKQVCLPIRAECLK